MCRTRAERSSSACRLCSRPGGMRGTCRRARTRCRRLCNQGCAQLPRGARPAPVGLSATGSADNSRRRSVNSSSTISGCATTSAGQCSTADDGRVALPTRCRTRAVTRKGDVRDDEPHRASAASLTVPRGAGDIALQWADRPRPPHGPRPGHGRAGDGTPLQRWTVAANDVVLPPSSEKGGSGRSGEAPRSRGPHLEFGPLRDVQPQSVRFELELPPQPAVLRFAAG